jgi:MarR family transcriptional regulator for hemolysin
VSEVGNGKPPAEIDVENFSSLVANMSRLLTGLARLKPFSDADMGVADWVGLTNLAREDGVSNKAFGRSLGVSGQRANQICTSLSSAGMITVTQSAVDNRANEIKITEAGRAKVTALNAQLKLLLAEALKGKERSVAGAHKHVKLISHVVGRAEKQERPAARQRKEARRAERRERRNQSASAA